MRFGIITGFGAEAALLPAGGPWRVAMAGGRPDRAYTLACTLLAQGATALISFGIAGGLAPHLAPGSLVVADAVWAKGEVVPTTPALTETLAARLPAAQRGRVACTDGVVATPAEKHALWGTSTALAVDLESWGMARAAVEFGMPFAIIRAVADPATRALPAAAAEGLDEQGRVRLGFVLWSLAKRPSQLPGLVRVGLDAKTALKALAMAVPALRAG